MHIPSRILGRYAHPIVRWIGSLLPDGAELPSGVFAVVEGADDARDEGMADDVVL